MHISCLLALSCLLLPLTPSAPLETALPLEMALPAQPTAEEDPCAEVRDWDDDGARHCETRQETLPAGPLAVDAGANGGIQVEGWDQTGIQVVAIVTTHAESEERARALASQVELQTAGNRVLANGPSGLDDEGWSVSYRIRVPRQNDLDLDANNGGISITGVGGTIQFKTQNGGVHLVDLSGSVRGRAQNGGLNVSLVGQTWDGEGLDVETTNGGIMLAIPEAYNAQLETRTERRRSHRPADDRAGRAQHPARLDHDAWRGWHAAASQDHERRGQHQAAVSNDRTERHALHRPDSVCAPSRSLRQRTSPTVAKELHDHLPALRRSSDSHAPHGVSLASSGVHTSRSPG
ncbi:MAG: hypothetical protein ACRD2X_19465 [Vicinamibacteraceae bacterium]